MGKMDYHEIIGIMRDNKFWIYGYGKVAKRLYRQVVKRGFENNLSGFIVTEIASIHEFFCEKPVAAIDKVDKDDWIVIGTDVASTEAIIDNLKKYGFKKYIRAFFSIIDLECGLPIEPGKIFSAKRFFFDSSASSWICAIYLAATKYNSRTVTGKKIYINLVSAWLGREVAEKDYYRFMHTVELCESNGFVQDYPIKICKDLYLLDGSHRIVLSQCFGDGKVLADVYDVSREDWEKIISKRTLRLDDDRVLLDYLTEEELKVLKAVPSQVI